MTVDVEDLILHPFKELIETGNEATRHANAAKDENLDIATHMIKAASSVVREGERALQKLQPLWNSQVDKYGRAFEDAISSDDEILEGRRILDDLLYDFDDFIEIDTFEEERFSQVQTASKSFARLIIEKTKRLRLDETQMAEVAPLSIASIKTDHSPDVVAYSEPAPSTIEIEVPETRRGSSPDVLGAEIDRVQIVRAAGTNAAMSPTTVQTPAWTTPRTTAWVNKQSDDVEPKPQNETIPEDAVTSHVTRGSPASTFERLTYMSIDGESSLFDGPTSPATTGNRTSVFSTAPTDLYNKPLPVPSEESPIRSQVHADSDKIPIPVTQYIDPGLIPVEGNVLSSDGNRRNTSTNSPGQLRDASCAIGDDSSLHQLGSFCEGAVLFRTSGVKAGVTSSFDFMNKTYLAKCVACEYGKEMSKLQADAKNKAGANFISAGVRYRLRFLYESHLATNLNSVSMYGCLFCRREGQTTRKGDATVFGSPEKLLQHLARHPQPLPLVDGIKVCYGDLDAGSQDAQDYDLHFKAAPIPNSISDAESEQLARLPVARVSKAYLKYVTELEPVKFGNVHALHFYVGAQIIGIEFPDKGDGKWGIGWHDGVRGYFPSKVVSIEPPYRGQMRLSGVTNEGITLKARWKWAPKDPDTPWLTFDKNDTITKVSWVHFDEWYWSGMTKNGKVGLFPKSHIKPESIRDAISTSLAVSVGSSGKSSKLFSLRRMNT